MYRRQIRVFNAQMCGVNVPGLQPFGQAITPDSLSTGCYTVVRAANRKFYPPQEPAMSASKPATGKSTSKSRPLGLADSPLAHSIARKLMGFYLMLVALMVFTQISLNLYEQINRLQSEVGFIGHAYLPMASSALWSFDDAQLDASAKVLMQHEEVLGVSFHYIDADKKSVVINRGKSQELEHGAKLEAEEQSTLDILHKTGWHRFPVFYEDERQPRLLVGEMTLYVNTLLVLKRHAYATLVIVISCALSTVVMWQIIRSVLNSNLATPLRLLMIKLLQIQHVLPEGEILPEDLRKLRIERFGTELRLLEKQLEKIVLGMAMQSTTKTARTDTPSPESMNDMPVGYNDASDEKREDK